MGYVEMDTDTPNAMLKRKRQIAAGDGAALAAAYRHHEEVEEALDVAVAHLAGVADSQELADDLLELEELRDRIWDHLFVGTRATRPTR